jgi:isopentenyldiphosphate isomerase
MILISGNGIRGRVKIQPEEIQDYQWLSIEQAAERMTFKEGKKSAKK